MDQIPRLNHFLHMLMLALLFYAFPYVSTHASTALLDKVSPRLSVADGLASNTVKSIVKDSAGFFWFGTSDGLSRYDGYEFRNYVFSPDAIVAKQNRSLADNSIYTLLIDSSERLWVGTSKGLSLYVKQSDDFISEFLSVRVNDLVEDENGNIWIASAKGLYLYQQSNGQVSKVALPNTAPANQMINSLVLDGNTLWYATYNGLWSFDTAKHTIGDFRSLVFGDVLNSLTIYQRVMQVSTMRHGLVCIDLTQLSRIDCLVDATLNHHEVVLSVVSEEGVTLLGLLNGGLFKLAKDLQLSQLLSTQDVYAIYYDSDHSIWVGTGQGVIKIPPNAQHIQSVINDIDGKDISASISSIYMDDDIGLMGSSEGFQIFSDSNNLNSPWQFPNDIRASGVFRASDGSFWLGSSKGLLHKDDNGMELLFEAQQNFLWGSAFFETPADIWVGTQTAGVLRVNKKTKQFTQLNGDLTTMPKTVVTLYQDSQQRLWIGSFAGGLVRLNLQDDSFVVYVHDKANPNSIINNNVKGIYEDSNGKLWLTTWGGLEQLDPDTGVFTHFSQKDGLPSNVLLGLLVDDDENLWMSSFKGIVKFNIHTHQIEVFDEADGLPSNDGFSMGAYFKDSQSGQMYFGGTGLVTFHPSSLKKNTKAPSTRITKASYNGEDISFDYQYLDGPVYAASQITVDYPFEELSFEFAALDYLDPKRNQYQYQLEGFQSDWRTAKRRFASYSNLWPGEYIFRVKGSNKDGLWDPDGAVLKVTVVPPWWLTWWAYLLYVGVMIATIYGLVKWRTQSIYNKALILEGEVELRTAKIAQLLAQKERLFSHISHEFRTPLTLILRAVEHHKRRDVSADDKLISQSAQQNVFRLIRMVEQLLSLARFNFSDKTQPVSISLADCTAVVIDAFESAIISQKHKVVVDIADDIMVWVEADALDKIIVNLLSNAIKYTPSGGEITILASCKHSEVTLVVTDTGQGISHEDQAVIFEPFVRGKQRPKHVPGTGLGLALVKELVEVHQGKIWLESSLSTGSSFFVALPSGRQMKPQQTSLAQSELAAVSELECRAVEQMTITPPEIVQKDREGACQLLIIEDHPQMLSYLHSLFSEDYDCLLACDGKEGLALARAQIPDLILSDVMMPKVDGIAMTRVLKQDIKTSHIPIVLLSARGDAHFRGDGLAALANDYITKPFDPAELKLKLDNQLRFRALLIEHLAATGSTSDVHVVDITLNKTEQTFKRNLDEIIEHRYTETDFTVLHMAKGMFVTSKQLQRKLKGLFGLTPTEYLRDFRLKKAAELLNEGQRPSAVAIAVGFGAYTYFSACFQTLFGLSPKQYQLQHLSGKAETS